MSKHYLITWHESDGNDCTVYDSIIAAESEDKALDLLSDAIESTLKANGTEFETRGNQVDYYFTCSEDCTEDCEGHGGIALREVEAFDTDTEAREAHPFYHSWFEVDAQVSK